MSEPRPSDTTAAPQNPEVPADGAPLDDAQLGKIAGGTLRVTVRPVLVQTPTYTPLPDDTRQPLDPDMPSVDP